MVEIKGKEINSMLIVIFTNLISNTIVTSFMCVTLHIDCSSLAKHFHLFVSYAYIDLFI